MRHFDPGRVQLTDKELGRGTDDWTILIRPQADGGYLVVALNINTREVCGEPRFVPKDGIQGAIEAVVEDLYGMGIDMEEWEP